MRLLRYPGALDTADRGSVAVIGNFDGVHLGHRAVIDAGRAEARRLGAPLALVTFEPHPRRFFQPDAPHFQLTPLNGRTRVLAGMGIDRLIVVDFTPDIAAMPPDRFVAEVLIAGLGTRHLVVGYDFVFGKARAGTVETLRTLAAADKIGVTEVAPATGGAGEVYSSTAIRRHLAEGRPDEAARLLDRCWEIEGLVLHGDERGRQIGFPTANLGLDAYLQPALGVYAVWVGLDDGVRTRWHMGCTNVGKRPTFDGRGVTVEAHILDFDGELYDRLLRVAFVEYLRPERKFSGLEALREQIDQDVASARAILSGLAADDVRNAPKRAQMTLVA